MKIELRSIKHAKFASQETPCFDAKLYVDNIFHAHLFNEDQGGANSVEWIKNTPHSEKEIETYIASQTPKEALLKYGGEIEDDLETWSFGEVYKAEDKKRFKRDLTKNILYVNEKGELFTSTYKKNGKKISITSEVVESFKKKNPQVKTIYNEMPFEKAFDHYYKLVGEE